MKAIRIALVAILGMSLFSSPAQAEITVTPPEINVSSTRGEQITKTLQLTSDTPIKLLQVIPSDLEASNQNGWLVANAVQIKLPQTVVNQNEVIPIEFGIDGGRWTQSGEFSGSLLVKYDGGQQVIPVTIRVKDQIWLPLLVLGIGVGLGLWLTWYRVNGQKRDDLVVRMGQLRTQMRAEAEFSDGGLGQEFRKRIEGRLIEVESALSDRDWQIAEAESSEARKVWRQWQKGREDWLDQLRYQQQLLAEVEPVKDWQLGQDLIIQLDNTKRQIADDSTPDQLRGKLLQARKQIEQVLRAKATVDALFVAAEEGIRALPDTERERWRKERDRLKTDLTRLSLNESDLLEDMDSFKGWKEDVEKFESGLDQAIKDHIQESGHETKAAPTFAERMVRETAAKTKPLPSSPVVRPFDDLQIVNQAKLNLRLFGWVVQGVALVLLVWTGLNNLYSNNPTFGANRSNDYFALLAWGFAAEVTRDSVVKTIRGFGVPVEASEDAS